MESHLSLLSAGLFSSITVPNHMWHSRLRTGYTSLVGKCWTIPIYSGFGTINYYQFPTLKEHLSWHCFTCGEDVKVATIMWLTQQGLTFYASRMDIHVSHLWTVPHLSREQCWKITYHCHLHFVLSVPTVKIFLWCMGAVNVVSGPPLYVALAKLPSKWNPEACPTGLTWYIAWLCTDKPEL